MKSHPTSRAQRATGSQEATFHGHTLQGTEPAERQEAGPGLAPHRPARLGTFPGPLCARRDTEEPSFHGHINGVSSQPWAKHFARRLIQIPSPLLSL